MKKKLLIVCFFVIITAVLIYNYVYKSHRDISNEKESFAISVIDLKNDYRKNDSLANAKYLDKTIVIYGKITSLDLANRILSVDTSLSAIMKESGVSINLNDSIKLKGRFIGYDDLLEEFKMDECSVIR
jgi:predicted negative regulator of RcsB-dependent stress response